MTEVLKAPGEFIYEYPKPILYERLSDVPWDKNRWPNFSPDEPHLACPLTGEFYFDLYAFDLLQKARTLCGVAFKINSGHRSPIWNAKVGGKALSQHKRVAYDISIRNHDFPLTVFHSCRDAGFTGFGFYQSFLHVDTGRKRAWGTKRGIALWKRLGAF